MSADAPATPSDSVYAKYLPGDGGGAPASHYEPYPGAGGAAASHYAQYVPGGAPASHYEPYVPGGLAAIGSHYDAPVSGHIGASGNHYEVPSAAALGGLGAVAMAHVAEPEPAFASSDFLKTAAAQPLAQRGQSPGGPRRTEYDDEFNTYFKPGVAARTRRFDEAELAAHTRGVDASGGAGVTAALTNSDGSKLDTSAGRSVWGGRGAGQHNWVLTPEGQVRTMSEKAEVRGAGANKEIAHHSSLADAKDVVAAGEMAVAGGRLQSINNTTGHYQATAEQLYGAVDRLDKQGVVPHAIGPNAAKVEAHGETSVSALAALVGQDPKRAKAVQGEIDAAGNVGAKSALGVAGHQALITDAQAETAMHFQSMLGRRRDLEQLQKPSADRSAAKASLAAALGGHSAVGH